MRKALAIALALLSPLLFPAALAALVILVAAVIVPPVGILAGVLADALYRTPDMPPYATAFGAAASGAGYLMHRFIKTRIMGA